MSYKNTDSFDKFLLELNESINREEMVVFCGAGISRHSGLPLANELVREVLVKLGVLPEEIEIITNSVLPFEAFIEILSEHSDPGKIFDIFDLGEPNTNHFLLAKLAKAGLVTTICTTNFDLLIEKAFNSERLIREDDYRVFYKEADFDGIDWDDNTIRLIKIHGSVEDKENMAITLEQVASRVLSRQRQSVIDHIFSKGPHSSVLVLGYSCSDVFDISPQVESIRLNHKRVIYVDHNKNKPTVKDLTGKQQKNPFRNFKDSSWVLSDTDKLVKGVWAFCFSEKEYISPKSHIKQTGWQKYVETWFLESEEEYSKANKYNIAGRLFQKISEFNSAKDNFIRALSIARNIRDKRIEGIAFGNLGNTYRNLSDYYKAIDNYERALSIAREISDKQGEGSWLGNLGIVYNMFGDYHKAIDVYEQALSIARNIGDKKGEGSLLNNLGIAYSSLGDYQKAINNYEQALSIARDIGNKQGEGSLLGNLGRAYGSLGNSQKAIDSLEQALSIAREIGDKRNKAIMLDNLGNAYLRLGNSQKAIDNLEQALITAREIGYKQSEASSLGNLGNAYYRLGNSQKAIDSLEQALRIAREIGDKVGEGIRLGNLGNVYYSMGDYQKAINKYGQALSIVREIGYKKGEGRLLGNLGNSYKSLDDYQKAINNYEQALSIAREIGDKEGEKRCLDNLGNTYRNLGDYPKL